ncbi:hypothetical protein EXIGLDRAFT_666478 [Exidia glandulosa HHB12029]|uniref:DUF4218 domain-containing protein n=1 Tax=Exidia glandulosa HHB12029 TaxID=1314781 RepID=A0A165NTF6_EXIGL|nr:hypothetical protein EXIGLDRAFT_666478 [Exidia glandulosa HHB12029]
MLDTAAAVDSASPEMQKRLSRESGIKGTAILARLPGISLPYSFPCEFMHLVWIDLIPLLVALYSSDFKGLDEGSGEYRLTPLAWESIGSASKAAGDTIPSALGRRVPDLADERGYRTAETWSVWTLYIAPGVLKGRFRRNKYYNHFMQLVRLLNLCIQLEISASDIAEIRRGFIDWVKKFEEFFYQYDPARISVCTSIIHYLLHVADSIEAQGPVWVYWAFVMERHCGRIVRAVNSRKHPWASLNYFVLAEAQLQTVKSLYNLDRGFFLGPDTTTRAPGSFLQIPEYETCELLAPSRMSPISTHLASQLANVLAVWYGDSSDRLHTAIKKVLPPHIEEWGKVRRFDGGDTMHAADLVQHEERDMTYVRYEQLVDRFSHRQRRDPEFESRTFYGQLRRILVLTVSPQLAAVLDHAPQTVVIAVISQCADLSEPDSHGIRIFSALKQGVELTELRTVECVIGRVRTHNNNWAIVDRSDALSRVLFVPDGEATAQADAVYDD